MFDSETDRPLLATAASVARWREHLTRAATTGSQGLADPERIDLLRALEELSCAAAGLQAVVTAQFDASQRAEQAAAGVPAARQGRGIAAQLALARRESPRLGARHLGLAKTLVTEMPHTLAALAAGRITEWRATVIARETAYLALEHRQTIDAELAGTPQRVVELEKLSDGRLYARLLHLAQTLDVASLVERRRRAQKDRRVTARPAPDTMMYLTGLLPVRDGVAVLAALETAAKTAIAGGDDRTRGQIMADTLVARVTGRDPVTGPVPVTVNVILPDSALLGGGQQPAHLEGYGPIPADLARELATEAATADVAVQLRRLYAAPATGTLVTMESRARLFPQALAQYIAFRDQTCRTPWCDAPIRHTDHITPHGEGGPTSAENGQGLCEFCNHAKQAPGWRHTVTTRTPTGHTYTSVAPPIAS